MYLGHCRRFVGRTGDSHEYVLPFPSRTGYHRLLEGNRKDVGRSSLDVLDSQGVVGIFPVG